MNRDNLAALCHVLSFLVVVVIGFFTRTTFLREVLKPLGLLVFLLGMSLYGWAVAQLKGAFLGIVAPVSATLVKTGPYRLIRHPAYLGMIVSLFGLALGLRSIWGIAGTFLLFTPIGIYRAKLEEKALARRFGREWGDYRKRTHFLLPLLY